MLMTQKGKQTYNVNPFLTRGISLTHPNWIANSLTSSLFLQLIKSKINVYPNKNYNEDKENKERKTYLIPIPFCITLKDLT